MSKRLIMKRPRNRRVNCTSSAAGGRCCIWESAHEVGMVREDFLPDHAVFRVHVQPHVTWYAHACSRQWKSDQGRRRHSPAARPSQTLCSSFAVDPALVLA